MAFTFQKGSTLLLTDGATKGRELLISSFNISQTYLEESRSVRTLHSPKVVADTFTNSKSAVSFDFTCQLTPGDGLIFEWLGFIKTLNRYDIPMDPALVPLDLVLLTDSSVYTVTNAFITSLSLQMSKSGTLSVAVTGVGSLWSEESYPYSHSYSKQDSAEFIHGSLDIVGSPKFGGITLEITRDVAWVANHTVHQALSSVIRTPSTAVLDDMSISGTINYYKVDNSLTHSLNETIDFTYGSVLRVYLDTCKTLERWETSEIFKKQKDFKLLPVSTNAYIQF